jgi:hypothetical protein
LWLQGDTVLQVEQRGSEGQAFGKGDASKATLTLAAALARMAAGDTSLYITTQAVPTAPDGHPALYAPLIQRLAADLPVAPQLTANLVPQSINMWCGAASKGGCAAAYPHASLPALHSTAAHLHTTYSLYSTPTSAAAAPRLDGISRCAVLPCCVRGSVRM